jgi:hypothetical protein
VVAAEFEQRQLFGRLLGLEAANDHEAIGTRPTGGQLRARAIPLLFRSRERSRASRGDPR